MLHPEIVQLLKPISPRISKGPNLSLNFTSPLNVCSHLVFKVRPLCAKSYVDKENVDNDVIKDYTITLTKLGLITNNVPSEKKK